MQKMSLMLSVPFGIFMFQEPLGIYKIIGLSAAFLAIILTNLPNKKAANSIATNKVTMPLIYWAFPILTLLSSAVDKKPKALRTITDKDFLVALDMSGIALDREYTNRFNRVYRAYVINPANNVLYNEENACLLGKIAIRMNREMINNLMSLGLSESYALWIAVNRNSSTDERRNIRRMVRAMQHMDPDIMTEQMVVNVFSKTFSDQLTNLFISIMTDRFDAFDDDNEKYVYSAVSNAILDILNTMDIDEIKDIVFEYENELKRSGVKGRFSMMAISPGEYPAICRAMDEIEAMGIKIE